MNLIVCYTVFIVGLLLLLLNAIRFITWLPKTRIHKTLTLYLIASTFEGVLCFILGFLNPNNNFYLSHIFFSIQLLFLSLFYYALFQDKKIKQYVKYTAILVFLINTLQYLIVPSSFWQFNLLEIVSVCCLLISFGLIHLYNTMGENKIYFYFSLGMIVYFFCSCIIYLSGQFTLVFLNDPYVDQWVIKDLFFIVYQILIWKELKITIKNNND